MELIKNLSNEEYHADKSRVSSTYLKVILNKTPADLFHSLNQSQEKKKCFNLGQLTHAFTLENDISRFIVTPKFNCGSNAGKQDYYSYLKDLDSEAFYSLMEGTCDKPQKKDLDSLLELLLEKHGKVVVDEKDLALAKAMKEAVFKNRIARRWIENGDPEITAYYQDEHTGMACKARPDILNGKEMVMPDLKTISKGMDDNSLRNEIINRGYHISMEHYHPAVDNEYKFSLIFVSTVPPMHHCRIIDLWKSESFRQIGSSDRFKALYRIKDCMESGAWPGYDENPTVLDPPRWARESVEVEYDY